MTNTTATPVEAPVVADKRTTYTLNGYPYLYVTPAEVSRLTSVELNKKSNSDTTSMAAGFVVAAVVASLVLVAFAIIAGLLAWNSNGALASFAAALLAYVFGGVSYYYKGHSKLRREVEEATGLTFKDRSTMTGRLFWRIAHYIGYYGMPIALFAVWWPNVVGGLLAAILYLAAYISVYLLAASQIPLSKKTTLAIFKKYGSAAPFETEEDFDLRMIKAGAKEYKDDYDKVVISL